MSSILPHFRLLPRRLVYPRTFVPSWFSQIHALKEPPAYVSWLPKSLEPHFNAYKQKLLGEYEKLTNLLSSGQDVPDRQLATRWKELRPIADVFEELDVLLRTDEDVENMIADIIKKEDDDDDELIEIARLEKEQRVKQRQALEQKLLWLISPPTPFALVPGAQLELIAGAGGREAGLFARDLLDMYRSFAAYRGWSFTVTQEATMSGSEATGGASETPLSKACVEIVGRPEEEYPGTSMESSKVLGAFGQLCWEAGVHRVQRIPVTSGQHKIHTSTVAVSVLPITEETDIEIPEGELKWEYYRSSGAGGQHVNKTDSAVRLTHLPTGTVITCQQERSQLANKQLAFEKLLHKLRTERWRAQWEAMDTLRRSHVGNLDRSEKIRTYNFPQDRVTDHRLGRTWNGLSRFMRQSLGLSEVIQALVERDQFARLEKVLTDQKEKE